ncbi:thioredoxin domain-containing protein [Halorussus gelatinilyticus]|uniref:Thioredoxin domain-containing protein n=1 Tax=Halorussus gelatinilyticus TaxID=2937524 RepID=A0A8U0IGW1_9EURY|nr:thioredoxin domain-containing protein [Halorussus gelatinilyticus]UPW00330.1 thioredoxin domain-containing protein [Halorussus gelatinilyticus]
MTDADPTARNRLDEEESPYLRQHADNPVNWQPWDDAALDAAAERDVPIFLSVGYSACHWCHVMEEESFEDDEIAALLNENFVPIKVDREERPDLDSIYQTICQAVSGRGGWPLSVWLTPDGRPFYVGTYFPNEPKRGQPGFGDLLENIAESWSDEEDRREMDRRADQWTDAIEGELESVPDPGEAPGEDLLETAADAAVRSADREHGGFGTGQKFPQAGRVHLLLRAADRAERDGDDEAADEYREVATEALSAMAEGGLFDHVGGGFHRYTVDREWVVPHFEKMLYDEAEISRAMLAGYQVAGDERYATAARRTFEFVERELTHPEGGFYSTLDAQSDGEEGKFYVWTPDQIREAVAGGDWGGADADADADTAADLFCDRYGVTESGNFEGETVLTVSESIPSLADEYELSEREVERTLEDARERVFDARAERVRPRRDEKVLAGWNGLMISALAEGALVLDDDRYADLAADALGFVRDKLWNAAEGRLSRRFKDGDVAIEGYLEDYAFLARGALNCYEATGDPDHLDFALDLADAVVAEFWDAEAGTIYFTPERGEELVARPQEPHDQSTPSSLGVAADTLLALAEFTPDDEFAEVAERVLETRGREIRSNPLQHASLALAADRYARGSLEITVVADDLPESWRADLADRYLPTRLLSRRPPTDDELSTWLDGLDLAETPPIWAERGRTDGEPTVYVCREFACSPPETDLAAALDWADERA